MVYNQDIIKFIEDHSGSGKQAPVIPGREGGGVELKQKSNATKRDVKKNNSEGKRDPYQDAKEEEEALQQAILAIREAGMHDLSQEGLIEAPLPSQGQSQSQSSFGGNHYALQRRGEQGREVDLSSPYPSSSSSGYQRDGRVMDVRTRNQQQRQNSVSGTTPEGEGPSHRTGMNPLLKPAFRHAYDHGLQKRRKDERRQIMGRVRLSFILFFTLSLC